MSNMIGFLQQAKERVSCRVHAVLGNEACDLDSAASALVYAYLLGSMETDTLVVPLLNIAEDEYPLKTEVVFFLHKLGITKHHLVFRRSMDLTALHRDGRLLLTLVDRHRLDDVDAALSSTVVQVIDHHEPDRPISDDVTIEMVGSCCTLVAERLFSLNRALIDRTVADLLLGTILLDTVNMSSAARRVTSKDRLMVSFLEPLSSGYGQNQLFDMLQKAKGDVSQLSSFELLRKDQKTADGGGLRLVISSVPMLVKDYVRAPDAVSACNQLCQSLACDLLMLMGSQAGEAEFSRDLAVFSARDDARHMICAILEQSVSPCLGLSRVTSPHARLVLYTQANVAASRKTVLPLIRSHLSGSGGSGELSPIGRSAGRAMPEVTYSGPRTDLPSDIRPPNGVDLGLSAQAVALLEPTSAGGSSSQSSAYNSVPYTPQNSVADSDSVADITLPSFNSRDLLQRIELRRGPLGGFEGADDIGAYPFTPKNSFVESSLETSCRHLSLSEIDSDMFLQKVHEKKRKSNLFDDITEEEDGRSGRRGSGSGGGAVGGSSDDRRCGVLSAQTTSWPAGTHQTARGTMRSDRGPALGSADLTPTPADKTGSQGSLDEVTSPQRPASTVFLPGPAMDGDFTSDQDDDTTTFKSALSSSEAIRRRAQYVGVISPAATADVDGRAAMCETTAFGARPVRPDRDRLWHTDGGPPVSDCMDHGSAGDRSHVADSPSLSASGPESLNVTEDDYYEDFTLPGTHEAIMSRQKSFRRRVQAAPVAVPDADRIEGVVRAGELERHGSIRRRLVVPAAAAAAPASAGSPGRFVRDLREIEELMAEDGDQVALDELPSLGPVLGSSTPKSVTEQPASLPPLGDEPFSMESSTAIKIRECLDREKVRDIYKISGRLQDILTAEDIQEILAHSELYTELLGEGILAELRSSMSESPRSLSSVETSDVHRRPPVPAPRLGAETRSDVRSSRTWTASAVNSIQVEAEITSEPVETRTPSPRHRVAVAVDVSSDSVVPHYPAAGLPAELAAEVEAGWPSGAGSPSQVAAREGVPSPPAGQRRLPAPYISLDDSEGISEPTTTPVGRQKLPDADSGVSEGALTELSGDDAGSREEVLTPIQNIGRAERRTDRPGSLGQRRRKKISVSADVLADDDTVSACSQLDSDTDQATPTDGLVTSDLVNTLTPDDIETPDELEDSILERLPPVEPILEYSAREELQNERSWRTCVVAGLERRIDMKVIEPYKKVLSHGGYLGVDGDQAIVVFSACYLPDRSRRDYSYVMDNLFLYVLTTLDALIADDYVLIYLHGATQRSCMPAFNWLKRCYQMVDRRLRKNLKGLYLVHPTFWVKTIVALTRPFISSKFSRKLRFVSGLRELSQLVPMDHVCIPDRVKHLDFQLMISERKKQLGIR